jgi:serine/threonine-protein kinase
MCPIDVDEFVPLPLATDLSVGTVVGEYTIDCKLGEGGMATVYGATHPVIGKKAAIKVMSPAMSIDAGLVERFVLEARAVNEIGHPNIVDVFSFGQLPDGRSYFVMEWLQGETLYARLWQRRLTLEEALDVIDQMCDALEAAHEKGIVHRDLKPANVFLSPMRGRRELVKVLDFGIAKLTRPSDDKTPVGPQTQVGQVVGTPDYIAPEQARCKPVTGKADVYALGVMAYEMILGRLPFTADNAADMLRMHLSDKPPVPKKLWPEIPPSVNQLMLAMLEKDPEKRPLPSQIRELIAPLRGPSMAMPTVDVPADFGSMPGVAGVSPPKLVRRSPAPARPVPPPVARPASRHVGLVAWLVCGLAVLVGAGLVVARRPHAPAHLPLAVRAPLQTAAQPVAVAPPAQRPSPPPARASTLVVNVDAPDARIQVDGRLIADAAASARAKFEQPGEHVLIVSAPGRKPYRSHVAVAAGATVQVSVHLGHPSAKSRKAPGAGDPDYLVDPFGGGPK